MERSLICALKYRAIFFFLVVMSIICLICQYGFNYASISQCITRRGSGYVATRVVERVYFELPNSPTPPQTTAWSTTTSYPENDLNQTTEQSCKPQRNVVFLKTHKTGSSTITNILNRYADWNNLTMLLPKEESFYSFNWPNKFRLSFAKDNHGKMPNILANHARYSRKSLNVLFPRDTTAYVTILRQPVKQWESTFSYMSFPYILNIHKKSDPLDFFLKNPPSFENIHKNSLRFPSLLLIKNPLFFDLGLDYKYYGNATMIRRAIQTLENDFNLVLMMEHFDESMVLLKRRLCWDIDDVVYFKTNERLNKNKHRELTKWQKESIEVWNGADVALYDYFIEKFWKEIEKEGPDFYEDLQDLKARKKHYFQQCIEKEAVTEAYNSVYVKGYAMRKNLTGQLKLFCERMLRNELAYQDYFKDNYIEELNRIEGETIENFNEELEEAEIEVEISDTWGEEGQSYNYGLPTKRPRPPPSKVTILKTRVQKQKEKAAAELAAKKKREAAISKLSAKVKGKLVSEEGSDGSNRRGNDRIPSKRDPHVEKVRKVKNENVTLGTVEHAKKNSKEEHGKGRARESIITRNNQTKNMKNNADKAIEDKRTNSAEKSKTVYAAEIIDRTDPRLADRGDNRMNNARSLRTQPSTLDRIAASTQMPFTVTNTITFEDKLTTLAKQIIDLDSTGVPEMTPNDKGIGKPVESANKELPMNDSKRYDGKSKLNSKKKH